MREPPVPHRGRRRVRQARPRAQRIAQNLPLLRASFIAPAAQKLYRPGDPEAITPRTLRRPIPLMPRRPMLLPHPSRPLPRDLGPLTPNDSHGKTVNHNLFRFTVLLHTCSKKSDDCRPRGPGSRERPDVLVIRDLRQRPTRAFSPIVGVGSTFSLRPLQGRQTSRRGVWKVSGHEARRRGDTEARAQRAATTREPLNEHETDRGRVQPAPVLNGCFGLPEYRSTTVFW